MTDNLYDILGVSLGADKDRIKKAYREGVKRHHPDAGGDPEAFRTLQEAYDVLSDEDRRCFYDATGQIQDKAPTPEDSERIFREEAIGLIHGALSECLTQLSDGPIYNDVVKSLVKAMNTKIKAIRDDVDERKAAIVRLTAFAKRFEAKDGKPNVLRSAIEYRIRAMEKALEMGDADTHIARFMLAIDILNEHSFKFDEIVANGLGAAVYNPGLGFNPLFARQGF